jgi:hypothetical protein
MDLSKSGTGRTKRNVSWWVQYNARPEIAALEARRPCGVSILAVGFGLKAVRAKTGPTIRRARRWRNEAGLPPSARRPITLGKYAKRSRPNVSPLV